MAAILVPGRWFCVPLADGRWAAGRAARVHPGGKAVVSYFFGPYTDVPTLPQLGDLVPQEAVLVGKHGEAAVKQGAWPVIGDDANDETWPLPVFKNRDPIAGRLRRVQYSEGDLLQPIAFEVSDDPALADAPEDGAMGTGFVEKRLSRLLGALTDNHGVRHESEIHDSWG